jgi:hypothetical protein
MGDGDGRARARGKCVYAPPAPLRVEFYVRVGAPGESKRERTLSFQQSGFEISSLLRVRNFPRSTCNHWLLSKATLLKGKRAFACCLLSLSPGVPT